MLVLDNSTIKAVIDEYAKSEIQSEAEVRSKLVVPLLCALGYPSELRAEEFPVYGFGGRKKLPAKSADFLLFSDKEFGAHRNDTQKDKDWVQSHSLLIVEAKKPGEMPDSPGQAQFYTMWTKAVAYMVTDGCEIQAYCYSDISADYRIICCTTNELPYIENLGMLSFDNVRAIKEKEQVAWQECNALQNSTEYPVHIITDDAELNLPNETLAYIRNALGRNADGLSNVQLVAKYLNATDSFLQNDLRYDIPAYMITLPSSSFDDDIVIEEPFLCQENEPIPLQDRVIHGITFRPYRSAFLPCKISLSEIKKDDIVRLPGCCEYRIVETK